MKLLENIIQILKMKSVRIRTRFWVAGLALSIAAIATPIYISSQSANLFHFYDKKNQLWDLSYRCEVLMKKINKAEAYLEPLSEKDFEEMDAVVTMINDSPHLASVKSSKNFTALYRAWKQKESLSPTQERRNIVQNLQIEAEQLEKTLSEKNDEAKVELGKRIRYIRQFSLYSSALYFSGLLLFLISLWFTLMPDLSELLRVTQEFKHGNLERLAQIPGKTETAELSHAFNEMILAFKEKTEKLKELNQVKSDFVSTVSHELRTPLTAIRGSIGLILGGVTGPLDSPEMVDMLKITQKNTDRLIRLINDVLDIAKIEAGAIKLNFDKVSLDETIQYAIQGVEGFARTHKVNLTYEPGALNPMVVMDKDRIVQVITNLLSNAIKFTDEGGYVKVSYETTQDKVLIHVKDNGKGIPKQFIEKMFEKFHQVEASTNKVHEGTGLGLAIVKGLLDEHGGQIWAESEVEAGSQFTFTLPWNGVDIKSTDQKLAA